MSSENQANIAIEVEELSKCYQIYDNPSDRLKQMLMRGKKKYYREFWALKNVNFKVEKGETIGILGLNGAGKSTLLQIICGTVNPTHGKVQTNGKISALLELGAGFNPEFTGRENVHLSCSLYGMSDAEIAGRFDEIIEFAGIGAFIDQPVKHYSSGMYARLAFSAAVHVEPAILIVDEALSVGDMAFQERSITRMKEIRAAGTSILFVSHSISSVRNFCDRAIWLERGEIRSFNERLIVCEEYQNAVENSLRREKATEKSNTMVRRMETAEDRTITIAAVTTDKDIYKMGDDINIDVCLSFQKNIVNYGVGVLIYDTKGNIVSVLNTLRDDILLTVKVEKHRLRIINNHLAPGEYSVTVSIPDEQAMFSYDKREHCIKFTVAMERNIAGLARVEGIVRCEHEWH